MFFVNNLFAKHIIKHSFSYYFSVIVYRLNVFSKFLSKIADKLIMLMWRNTYV